jgi:hypothetical protein
MTIKDVADLFAAEGERAKDVIESLKEQAKDALDVALSDAPEGSQRERYRYATERAFPLIERLRDEGERGAALDDVAKKLKLRKSDLRNAFAKVEQEIQQRQENDEYDEGQAEENLTPEPGTERYERAMELLRDPEIPRRAAQTMEWLGHVGEWLAKMLAFVCAVSARAGRPIQPSTHAESATGKNFLWDTVILLLPPEMVIKRSAISDKALFRTEADLRGAVLYLQEVAGSEGAGFTIRVLQSAQYLEYEATEKMPDGTFTTVVYRKEGPVVVVQTTTAIRLFHENDTRVFPIYLDESVEQTQRIVERAKKRAETGAVPLEESEGALGVWHDAIRLLEPGEVVVPYAQRIEIPVHRVRVRRDINRILDVIRVITWLHQHSRERDEQERILATEDDFYAARQLVADSLERAWQSLTPAEEAVMKAIASLSEAKSKNGFRRNDLEVEGHDKRRVQDALKALVETGYLESERKGGPGGYRYTLSRNPTNNALGITLRLAHENGEDSSEGPDADAREGSTSSGATGEDEEEERESRESAREEDRAVEDPVSSEEDAIALSRGEEDEDGITGRELWNPLVTTDPLEELTELGWFRVQTDFVTEESSEEDLLGEDPVVRRLRHGIPIYQGWSPKNCHDYLDDTPWAVTAEDVYKLEAKEKNEEELRSIGWPSTAEEMETHIKRVIPLLQRGPHHFFDPGLADWYDNSPDAPFVSDQEDLCKPAYLHAELWVNEETSEELWALTALKPGWRPPEKAIEGAVWLRVPDPRGEDTVIMPDDDDDDDRYGI